IVYPITLNDTVEVMCLVGDFAAQHNGAIITADSAVRYSDRRLECFGNVIINKNTTYAYADRADYDGDNNEVSLYAPIIKVVDEDATLYCYNFRFNTLDNVGIYEGGGVMINGDNLMESLTGYYYSDNKELIGVGDVQLRGDEYQMTSDSIIYNTETEGAIYFENTNIWNQENEYLYADAGDYNKQEDRYSFSLNGYILTEEQEMWSDSMDYYRASEHIYMRHNIQIDDTVQKSLIFGNYGEYIKTPGDIFLTGNPSIINYDVEQGDSLYMRADTFQVFTLNRFEKSGSNKIVSATELSLLDEEERIAQGLDPDLDLNHDHDHDHNHGHNHNPDDLDEKLAKPAPKKSMDDDDYLPPENLTGPPARDLVDTTKLQPLVSGVDSLSMDSLLRDSMALDSMRLDSLNVTKRQGFFKRMAEKRQAARKERQTEKAIKNAARKVVLDSIGLERQLKINEKLNAESVREARRIAERRMKLSEKEIDKIRRKVAKGKISAGDTLEMIRELIVDTTALIEELSDVKPLTLDRNNLDSLTMDSLTRDSLSRDSLPENIVEVDSLYRLTKGFRNVKIYRSDFQAIADSMVTSSIDSIIRLYINPILWHDSNQVTSDFMDIYTEKNQIAKTIFTGGTPIMASEVTPNFYYNQIAGKVITSLFADGAIYRNDADGNAQTIYFMQDDDTSEVNGMMVMESGSTTFYIEEQAVTGITYRGEPVYTLYPMNLIPSDQVLSLKGFVWQSEKRPDQKEVFDRTIRPTMREENNALSRPTFPLYEELNEHRNYLIESRMWLDRTDVISPRAEAWMESLGYKTGQPREQKREETEDDN
ncbi:MAG: OstA-like protein, partial [Rikenellaceae bacterium]